MKRIVLFGIAAAMAWGQAAAPAPPFSRENLKVHQYTTDEDARILKLYEGIRTIDIIDALDVVGLPEITLMDRNIMPMWRDEQKFAHRIQGVAVTLRVVPAQVSSPKFASHAAERTWEAGGWAPPAEMQVEGPPRAANGYSAFVHEGTILVVDNQARDNGIFGSNNSLAMVGRGLRGIVGNQACRDNDEMILTRIPCYQDPLQAPRGINQGRMWIESYNQPVTVGHVLVMPGDIIAADTDGVAVVPRAKAEQVAKIARWIYEDDEIKRGKIYDQIGRPRDWTVQGHTTPPAPSETPIDPNPVWNKLKQ
jgi:regulator of RNase E activity RraA